MSNKIAISAAVSILVLGVAGAAFAKHKDRTSHHRMGGYNMMKKADANNDGKVTKDELFQAQRERFKKLDLNNDGIVDLNEVQAKLSTRIEKRAKRMTRRFDENRDGKVTESEFLAIADKRLYIHDLNDDGEITKDEMRGPRGRGHRGRGHHRRRGKHHCANKNHGDEGKKERDDE